MFCRYVFSSKLKFNIPLKALPPMQRPAMRSRKCLSWHGKLAKSIIKEKPLKSIAEEGLLVTVLHYFQ